MARLTAAALMNWGRAPMMVTIFMPGGTTYKKLDHLIGDRAGLSEGEEFHGPLFPVVAGE